MEQALKNFIWTGACNKRKLPVPSNEDMCRPVSEVGMGTRSLKAMYRASLVKSTWRYLASDSCLNVFVKQKLRLNAYDWQLRCSIRHYMQDAGMLLQSLLNLHIGGLVGVLRLISGTNLGRMGL